MCDFDNYYQEYNYNEILNKINKKEKFHIIMSNKKINKK